MPKYKLIYFDLRGRAEPIRMLFALAGQEFEDVRIKQEQWPEMKPKMPHQQLPVLEIEGGVMLSQSFAIARYLANEFGLAGKTNLEKAQADMFCDALNDLTPKLTEMFLGNDEKKAEVRKELVEQLLPVTFTNMERLFSKNKDGTGCLVGDGLTWADVMFINFAEGMEKLDPSVLKNFPKLQGLEERVRNNPKIKEFIKNRPPSEM
ncbi:glutathione S-transferase 1-like [Ptychodera flava]|uniref:glutathione S-transferase 1-like n=1 Tax=Ptychodera flava TaxID=63121 RepID=UPI00396A1A06